jgi:hypothetical protein
MRSTRNLLFHSFWVAVGILIVLLAWNAVPWVAQRVSGQSASRPIASRGELAADERANIEIFDRSKGRWCTSRPGSASSIHGRATS